MSNKDYFQSFVRLEPPAVLNFYPATAGQTNPTSEANKSDIVSFLKIHNSAAAAAGQNLAYKIKTTAPKSY